MCILYKITDKIILYYYCYCTVNYPRKGFTALGFFYFAYLLINTASCEYDIQYQSNQDNALNEQKNYTFSQLNNDYQENQEENQEEDSIFHNLTSRQKQILFFSVILGLCMLSLWIIMNSENSDLQRKITELQAKIAKDKSLKPSKSEANNMEQEWKRPANLQFGFQ